MFLSYRKSYHPGYNHKYSGKYLFVYSDFLILTFNQGYIAYVWPAEGDQCLGQRCNSDTVFGQDKRPKGLQPL